ncbi:MAG: efflux RND transporter permease subunit [Spirochaetales bacterium]|jgi:multidrug efflux pump subunit AcrB|nr:efflux RND transporter permease subunit [Spirochaetales bacterium]
MIKFLIHRPIAVLMTFLAILTLGVIASRLLPMSLMPDIDIPEITIQVNRPDESARQIEDGTVNPMRYHLMQIPHLDDITTESRDGRATIRLRFNYGADINYAFIDANEKVDAAMRNLPPDMERPAIIKATASDLPVFYINLWMEDADNLQFMELSELARSVMIKRLEQLNEVAMVDVTGHLTPELYIKPNEELLKSLNLHHGHITQALEQNNMSMGSIEVADGQYRFNIRFANKLRTVEDVKNIRLKAGPRMLKLSEIAEIGLRPAKQQGAFLKGNTPALSLAVIKQSDARMDELKESVNRMLNRFEQDYPRVNVEIVRDQTALLDYSISNLQKNLLFGGSLAFLILFFFLKDARSPWLIGISVPASLVISLLFFHIAGLSINIISLSGLILGMGMMIDNAIIVIDNITQHAERGESLAESCIRGTNEVIRPLISSVLTTCAVFVPLIFISGISGALFYDQAMAVGIGLLASLIVSITLIPVLYHIFSRRAEKKGNIQGGKITKMLQNINLFKTSELYEKGFRRVFKHRKAFISFFLFLIIPALIGGLYMTKERFPSFSKDDVFLKIDWNRKINLEENIKRVNDLNEFISGTVQNSNAYAGTQKYMLHKDLDQSVSEALLYFKANSRQDIEKVKEQVSARIEEQWPVAVFSFRPPGSIFEKLFQEDNALLVAHVSDNKQRGIPDIDKMERIVEYMSDTLTKEKLTPPVAESHIEVRAKPEIMALYEVEHRMLFNRLQSALNAWEVDVLHTGSQYVPILIGNAPAPVHQLINELKVNNQHGTEIPVKELVSLHTKNDYKILYGSAQGAFVPVDINVIPGDDAHTFMETVSRQLKRKFDVDTVFTGSWFSSRQLVGELTIVLLIALSLLYFILAAQFESLRQPLIILLEVPIDIAGAFFLLWIFGGTINIMSMIGIVVMSGIIVNDSILKIDTINRLYRDENMPLLSAIQEGGHRRLKPIIMTSVTTILALVPVLWGSGMGSELQRPLALTVIGGMVLGTVVSLYFIPLCYYYLMRRKRERGKEKQKRPERAI